MYLVNYTQFAAIVTHSSRTLDSSFVRNLVRSQDFCKGRRDFADSVQWSNVSEENVATNLKVGEGPGPLPRSASGNPFDRQNVNTAALIVLRN